MGKAEREKILEYIGDKWALLFVGFLCLVYYIFHLLPQNPFVASILPPLSRTYYLGVAVGILIYQVFVWVRFGLLKRRTLLDILAWALFISEFSFLCFTVGILSWPVYFFVILFQYLGRLV